MKSFNLLNRIPRSPICPRARDRSRTRSSNGMRTSLLCCLALLSPLSAAAAEPEIVLDAPTVTICRDAYGVPHIYADTDEGAYYGLGYSCVQDRYFQMLRGRLAMQGRMAEFFEKPNGPKPEKYVLWDKGIRVPLHGRRFG